MLGYRKDFTAYAETIRIRYAGPKVPHGKRSGRVGWARECIVEGVPYYVYIERARRLTSGPDKRPMYWWRATVSTRGRELWSAFVKRDTSCRELLRRAGVEVVRVHH